MRYLSNAMSLGMLDDSVSLDVTLIPYIERVQIWLSEGPWVSSVGHADTALLLSDMLGVEVPMRRVSTSLQEGDELLVAQYSGPRLPEGATSLPEGAKIRWYLVRVRACEREYAPLFARVIGREEF